MKFSLLLEVFMSLKYEPTRDKTNRNNFFFVLKVVSVAIIGLSLLMIFWCFKKNSKTKAAPSESANDAVKCADGSHDGGATKKENGSKHKNKKKRKKKKKTQKNSKQTPNVALKKNKKTRSSMANSDRNKKAIAIAQAKTTFPADKSQANRVYNIKKAVEALNDAILMPDEEFSFGKIYRLSHKNGEFKCAADSDTKKMVYAGGLSQVCTVLFEAVQKANLKIVEHHNFDHKVFYSANAIRFEKDKADFKFKNSKKFPIKIKASFGNDYIKISIIKIKNPKN